MTYKKLYFARFVNKVSGETFYKFGWTAGSDAYNRFKGRQYSPWYIKIMTSATGPALAVEQEEGRFLRQFKKDFKIEPKIKGVTEIRKLTREQVNYVFEEFKILQKRWGALEYRKQRLAQLNSSSEKFLSLEDQPASRRS